MRQAARRGTAGKDWHDSDHVFTTRSGRPIEPRNRYRSFLRIASSAGLPQVRLHDTRHGCASPLFAAGVAPRTVMEILGHSQIAVTMNVYTHVSDDNRREVMGHMNRLLKRRRQAGLPSRTTVNALAIHDRGGVDPGGSRSPLSDSNRRPSLYKSGALTS